MHPEGSPYYESALVDTRLSPKNAKKPTTVLLDVMGFFAYGVFK